MIKNVDNLNLKSTPKCIDKKGFTTFMRCNKGWKHHPARFNGLSRVLIFKTDIFNISSGHIFAKW